MLFLWAASGIQGNGIAAWRGVRGRCDRGGAAIAAAGRHWETRDAESETDWAGADGRHGGRCDTARRGDGDCEAAERGVLVPGVLRTGHVQQRSNLSELVRGFVPSRHGMRSDGRYLTAADRPARSTMDSAGIDNDAAGRETRGVVR